MEIPNETALQRLAAQLAPQLQAGDVLLLDGDLGAGKTSFTKGLAEGLGITAPIKSPTFTLIREYQTGRLPLYHMDLYRLADGGADALGLEEYFDGDGVSVVEWPDYLTDMMPEAYLMIHLVKDATDDNRRHLTFDGVGARGVALQQAIERLG